MAFLRHVKAWDEGLYKKKKNTENAKIFFNDAEGSK